ncbi:MAG TPA: hypothetical protein QGH10_11280 [Armatimonadota bacterium]|nr:hypothetical protein [Armatimonadota bacterium]
MRNTLWALMAAVIAASPSHAAWVWVYEGERHVVMPPEVGQPAWASYPDDDDDGRPDSVVTNVRLRIENEAGDAISKIRVGKTIRLIAEPELGGLETETLTVQFYLRGPGGAMPVVPADSIREAQPLGTAPATYRAMYAIPEEPVALHAGDYEASVEITLGNATMPAGVDDPVALRIAGPRESTTDKVERKVRRGLEKAGHKVKEFGEGVFDDVSETWSEATAGPPPGSLRQVQPRETAGIATRLSELPTSPLAPERDALAIDRAGALRSKKGPARSVLFIPYDEPRELTPEGWIPLGQVLMTGLRISTLSDGPKSVAWTLDRVTGCRVALEMEPMDTEGYVHFLAPGGESVGRIPADAEWFGGMVFPSDTHINQKRHPDTEDGGLVKVKMVVPLTKGSVRAAFEVPVIGVP